MGTLRWCGGGPRSRIPIRYTALLQPVGVMNVGTWRSFFLSAALLSAAQPAVGQTSVYELPRNSVNVGDAEISYWTVGDGPPLMLLHPFAFTADFWAPYIDALSEDHRLIIPELRGHGFSTIDQGAWSYAQAALDMFAVLDQEGVDRAAVIGYSAGGNTLIHMALQGQDRLARMVLVAGAHRLTNEARAGLRSFPRLEELPPRQREANRTLHPGGDAQVRELFGHMRALADNFADFDISPERLSTIETPTMLVWGDRDDFYPISLAVELYESLPNAALWILPGEAHIFLATDVFGGSAAAREAFAPNVLRFLAASTW
jgi:pimeloyl-ACP methyl ester carboxylesterase